MMPDAQWERMMAPLYGKGLKGKDRLTKAWYDNSVLKIIEDEVGSRIK